jgi:sec-independent protein translocase protein TatB
MDFMGMGPFEILLVLIIGFLFLGPEKLPGMAAKVGELYRDLTKATSNLTKSLTEEVSAEAKAASDMAKSVTEATREITDEVKTASELIKSPGQAISTEIKKTGKTLLGSSDKKTGE